MNSTPLTIPFPKTKDQLEKKKKYNIRIMTCDLHLPVVASTTKYEGELTMEGIEKFQKKVLGDNYELKNFSMSSGTGYWTVCGLMCRDSEGHFFKSNIAVSMIIWEHNENEPDSE